MTENYQKHRKMQVTKSQLVFAWCLVGVVHGASFLDQPQKEVKQNQRNCTLLLTFNQESPATLKK